MKPNRIKLTDHGFYKRSKSSFDVLNAEGHSSLGASANEGSLSTEIFSSDQTAYLASGKASLCHRVADTDQIENFSTVEDALNLATFGSSRNVDESTFVCDKLHWDEKDMCMTYFSTIKNDKDVTKSDAQVCEGELILRECSWSNEEEKGCGTTSIAYKDRNGRVVFSQCTTSEYGRGYHGTDGGLVLSRELGSDKCMAILIKEKRKTRSATGSWKPDSFVIKFDRATRAVETLAKFEEWDEHGFRQVIGFSLFVKNGKPGPHALLAHNYFSGKLDTVDSVVQKDLSRIVNTFCSTRTEDIDYNVRNPRLSVFESSRSKTPLFPWTMTGLDEQQC